MIFPETFSISWTALRFPDHRQTDWMYSSLAVFDDPIFASSLQPLALQLHSAASKSFQSSWSHYEVDQITSTEKSPSSVGIP